MIANSVDGAVVSAIEEATKDVFSKMIGVDLEHADTPYAPADLNGGGGGVLTSFALTGAISGVATVSYSIKLAKWITGRMLQCEDVSSENDVLDAAGEVANMIVGNVKNELEHHVGAIQIGTPSVEKVHQLQQTSGTATGHAVTFRCRESIFAVSINFLR